MSTHVPGFPIYQFFFHYFVFAKLATSSVRVRDLNKVLLCRQGLYLAAGYLLFSASIVFSKSICSEQNMCYTFQNFP